MGTKYTKKQGQHFMERYHTDEEFRKRMISHIKNYKMRNPYRTWSQNVIHSHKARKVPMEITRQELEKLAMITTLCKLCGCILEYGCRIDRKKIWNLKSASADRIDNMKPLNTNNIQIICHQCNSAKGKMSMLEFKKWINQISSNF
jgi:5-methylcytosine-specific restriction endonuclease McrA